MENCLFCKIIAGVIPSTKVYEDDLVFAFRDIAPQAPTHILVIPKAHIDSCNGITAENSAVVAHIFEVIPQIAKAEGLENGYRVVSNCGDDGCQSVHHLHFHILGGKKLSEQMALLKNHSVGEGLDPPLHILLDFPVQQDIIILSQST